MKEGLQILVVGRHEEIVQTLLRIIINTHGWLAEGCLSDERAMSLYDQFAFDIVLLSSGISPQSEDLLRTYFSARNPGIIIIQHYGGGSGLLANEIRAALEA